MILDHRDDGHVDTRADTEQPLTHILFDHLLDRRSKNNRAQQIGDNAQSEQHCDIRNQKEKYAFHTRIISKADATSSTNIGLKYR